MAAGYQWNGNVQYLECSQHVFNEHLKCVYKKLDIHKNGKYSDFKLDCPGAYYLKVGNSKVYLSYKYGGKWINLITDLYKEYEDINYIDTEYVLDGGHCYGYFRRFCHIEDVDIPVDIVHPFSYCNEKYVNSRHGGCIGYDMNAAYLGACKNLKVPIKLIDYDRRPGVDEIGFQSSGIPIYGPSNIVCGFIFTAAIDAGMQRWVDKVTELYLNKNPNAKPYYQRGVGMIRRHNIALYNTILHAAGQRMLGLLDENSLWSTTDSIVSLKPRDDLPISCHPGDFKIEHTGDFAYIKTAYQWNFTAPQNKGVAKGKVEAYNKTHEHAFDILLKDQINIDHIKYKFKEGFLVDEAENIL